MDQIFLLGSFSSPTLFLFLYSIDQRDLLNHPEQGWKVPPKLTSEKAHLFNAACTFTPKPPIEKADKRSSLSAKAAAKELELAKKLERSLAAAAAEEAEREKDAIKNGEDVST